MAKDTKVNGLLHHLLLAPQNNTLFIVSHILETLGVVMMPTMVTPTIGHTHAQPRMNSSKEALVDPITKHPFQKIVAFVKMPQSVAMPYQEAFAVNGHQLRFGMHSTPHLLLKIVEHPHVMVANEVIYHYPSISHPCQLPGNTTKTTWNHITICEPKIKHIAQHHQSLALRLYSVKQRHEFSLTLLAIGATAQMGI